MRESCDALIVGGGPAGSTCAWLLRQAGLDVLVVDKQEFPRDKTCAGWITPPVIQALNLDTDDYARSNVFQPILGFRTSILGYHEAELTFDEPVSFGIRRCEFDNYLLRRSGARCRLGYPIQTIERRGTGWIINRSIESPLLIGAGGHFCPVARMQRQSTHFNAPLVTAQEAEFPLTHAMKETLGISPTSPELYFCDDLAGYGWCVGKGDYLNIGIGRVDCKDASSQLVGLQEFLRQRGKFAGEVPVRFHGHAYHLYNGSTSHLIGDQTLLIGDAAGLAYPQSGEGIRPAVESAIMAAETIVDAQRNYGRSQLAPYRERIESRFGRRHSAQSSAWKTLIPIWLQKSLVTRLVGSRWFARNIIINRWFLHVQQPSVSWDRQTLAG